MKQFHELEVTGLQPETPDSMRIELAVPPDLREQFAFRPGQHLPLQAVIDGRTVRRTYSICSVPGEFPLEIGVRIQPGGRFSQFVAKQLAIGDRLQVMPPFGQFHVDIDPQQAKTYIAFAAGSGITPILSIVRATLENAPQSRFVLFYGNREHRTTMFIDDLFALKNRFTQRLQLCFLFTREEQEFAVFSGRMDEAKTTELYQLFCAGLEPDEAFVCGPDTMIDSVSAALQKLGMADAAIHAERYGAPRRTPVREPAVPDRSPGAALAEITVIMDGHRKTFAMSEHETNIVDAAAAHGIELPYSCKGGVCATCRSWVREGRVAMATNYGLEAWEVDQGYVLACQSRPISDVVVLDYDKL